MKTFLQDLSFRRKKSLGVNKLLDPGESWLWFGQFEVILETSSDSGCLYAWSDRERYDWRVLRRCADTSD